MSIKKDMRQVEKAAKRQGIKVDRSGKHPAFYRPGKKGRVTYAGTGSDYRGLKNTIADMRRVLGFKWKGR